MLIFISAFSLIFIFALLIFKVIDFGDEAAVRAARRAFQERSIGPNTAGGYKNKCDHFSAWMKTNYPLLMNGPEKEGYTFDWEKIVAEPEEGKNSFAALLFEAYVMSIKRRRGNLDIPYSKETITGYRSAIQKLCIKCGYTFPRDWTPYTKIVIATVARVYAQNKKSGVVEDKSKIPLSFAQYYKLCRLLHLEGKAEHKELLAFTQLQWNVGCRSESIESMKLSHFKNFDDSLQVKLWVTKTKQKGEDTQPRYLYFNPVGEEKPGFDTRFIDLGLGLASYLATHHDRKFDDRLFYDGAAAVLRKRLKKFLRKNATVIGIDAADVEKLNFHSLRKGVGTHCSSGSIGGPSMVSIAIRMGHNIGIQGTYLQFEHAGDQFVGRISAGFDLNAPSYDTLPPAFETVPGDVHDVSRRVFGRATAEITREGIQQRLLANLIYHAAWLQETLPPCDPLRQNHLFANPRTLRRLLPTVKIGAGAMMATGIPPHVPVVKELRRQVAVLEQIQDNLVAKMTELFNQKFAELAEMSGSISRHELLTTLSQAQASSIATIREEIREEFRANREANRAAAPLNARTSASVNGLGPAPPGKWHAWPPRQDQTQGSWQRLPIDYKMPVVGLKTGLRLWILGNEAQGIGALRKIGSGYKETVTAAFNHKVEETNFYEWQACMIYLVNLGKMKWVSEKNEEFPASPSEDNVSDMWDLIKGCTGIPDKTPKGRTRNIGAVTVLTATRLLKDEGKIRRTRKRRRETRLSIANIV